MIQLNSVHRIGSEITFQYLLIVVRTSSPETLHFAKCCGKTCLLLLSNWLLDSKTVLFPCQHKAHSHISNPNSYHKCCHLSPDVIRDESRDLFEERRKGWKATNRISKCDYPNFRVAFNIPLNCINVFV